MRKIYTAVDIIPGESGFIIQLDGKPVKTAAQNLLIMHSQALAEAIAEEWRGQEIFIVPATMKMTQLASTAIDRVALNRQDTIDGLLEYAATDLVCYRATEPDELVTTQSALFDPLLEWFEERTGSTLIVARGLMPVAQPAKTLAAVRIGLEAKSDQLLTALQAGTALASSLVIALALVEGELSAEDAYQAACCDELYQIRKWGEDDEATERLNAVRVEFGVMEQFVSLLKMT